MIDDIMIDWTRMKIISHGEFPRWPYTVALTVTNILTHSYPYTSLLHGIWSTTSHVFIIFGSLLILPFLSTHLISPTALLPEDQWSDIFL
jgi:hypothetical protein